MPRNVRAAMSLLCGLAAAEGLRQAMPGACSWGDNGLEYNQNGPRQILVDWIKAAQSASTTFDFVTKGILQEAVKNCEVRHFPSVTTVATPRLWRANARGKHC